MITVLPQNAAKQPVQLCCALPLDLLQDVLVRTFKRAKLPVEVVKDTFSINSGAMFSGLFSGSAPCVAIYHREHKKDYHCIVLERKDAYGQHYVYAHFGGTSRNQMNINMGKTMDGHPGFFRQMIIGGAHEGLRDEELYYEAVFDVLPDALVDAEILYMEPQPKPQPQPQPKPQPQPQPKPQSKPQSKPASFQAVTEQKLEKSIGIETVGNVFTRVLQRNTPLPACNSMEFSTSADGQTSVEIHVLRGESDRAGENQSMGRYVLKGIPPMRRGVPRIQLTFDVDIGGNLRLSAKELSTGNQIQVQVTPTFVAPHKAPATKKATGATCVLSASASDEESFNWLDGDVCLKTGDGTTTLVLEQHTYIPTRAVATMNINAEDQQAFQLQVVESGLPRAQKPRCVGTLTMRNLPYSIRGDLQIEVVLNVDGKGKTELSARYPATGKTLPVTFTPTHR